MCFLVILKWKNLQVLFNSGSQMIFISEKARNQLNLKAVDKENFSVETFRNYENMKKLHRVQFYIRITGGENFDVSA